MLGLGRRPIRLGVVLLLIMAGAIWGLGSVTQAATLTVTKIADTSYGTCDADCSLREAIAAANSGDTVDIPAGDYTLTLGAALVVNKNLNLIGVASVIRR